MIYFEEIGCEGVKLENTDLTEEHKIEDRGEGEIEWVLAVKAVLAAKTENESHFRSTAPVTFSGNTKKNKIKRSNHFVFF